MQKKDVDRYKARAEIIKALGHPTRLFMVDQMAHQERSVQELTEMVGADISTISKHLNILKSCGIAQVEKRGNQVFYTLRVPCLLKFFPCIDAVLRSNAKALQSCLIG